MNDAIELLIEAKRFLEEDVEWCQGSLFDYGQDDELIAACSLGALNYAANKILSDYADQMEAEYRLSEVMGDSVVNFNDDPNTTREDILLAFKQAITDIEGLENAIKEGE